MENLVTSICQECDKSFTYVLKGNIRKACCKPIKKVSLNKLKELADAAISKHVRKLNPKCQLCGKKATVAYHVISRRYQSIRWDIRNILATCSPCNFGEKWNPARYIAKFIRKFSAASFLELDELSRERIKITRRYLEDVIKMYD